jgi:deoxyribose-phosphate aldolase
MNFLQVYYTKTCLSHKYNLQVATGFPTGQTSLKLRLEEIRFAVQNGAKEIDIVINRELALAQKWKGMCWLNFGK